MSQATDKTQRKSMIISRATRHNLTPATAIIRRSGRSRPFFHSGILGTSLMLLLLTGLPATGSATVLLGNSTLAPSLDMNIAGQAEAFQVTAASSGTVGVLMVYVDASSSATSIVAGLYSNVSGHPGALLAQGNLANPSAGSWNVVAIAATPVTAGTTYWIAILGTGGTLVFLDQCCPGIRGRKQRTDQPRIATHNLVLRPTLV